MQIKKYETSYCFPVFIYHYFKPSLRFSIAVVLWGRYKIPPGFTEQERQNIITEESTRKYIIDYK